MDVFSGVVATDLTFCISGTTTYYTYSFQEWIAKQPARFEWDRWVTMGCIGFLVGVTAFIMHQGI